MQFRGPFLETLKFDARAAALRSTPTLRGLTDRNLILRRLPVLVQTRLSRRADRQADLCSATRAVQPVSDLKNAAVRFAYLPREREADATSPLFGGVKRHKQI